VWFARPPVTGGSSRARRPAIRLLPVALVLGASSEGVWIFSL